MENAIPAEAPSTSSPDATAEATSVADTTADTTAAQGGCGAVGASALAACLLTLLAVKRKKED
jgi:hypothetical protein